MKSSCQAETYLFEKAYEFSQQFNRLSPYLFMRKYKLNYDIALKLCKKIKRKNDQKTPKNDTF